MKAKFKMIFILGILFCMVPDASAQARFYDTDRTFHEQGFTYVSNIAGSTVHLNNINTRWIGHDLMNRDGTVRGFGRTVEENNSVQMQQLARTIVSNAFSSVERQRIRGATPLMVSIWADSQTGVVTDVQFMFGRTEGFATIPVATYRRIELELRERIRFVPTAEGRRRNFLFLGIIYKVE